MFYLIKNTRWFLNETLHICCKLHYMILGNLFYDTFLHYIEQINVKRVFQITKHLPILT